MIYELCLVYQDTKHSDTESDKSRMSGDRDLLIDRDPRQWYVDRIALLTHNGKVYALSIILISQVIYLNLHYIIGAILSIIALVSLLSQIIIGPIEHYELARARIDRLERFLLVHFLINHLVIAAIIPLLIWTIVIMFQRASSA